MSGMHLYGSRDNKPNYIIYDIDGVFNPFMATDLLERGFTRYVKGWVQWDLDTLDHARWVRELEDYADIVWGSSWEDESNALAGWFHLKNLSYPHIPMTTAGSMSTTWKLPAISAWIEQNVSDSQKVVWVEDELFEDAFVWAKNHPNVLIVQTNPAVGLTAGQVESIKSFLVSC
jgi:hypothetical protein